MFEFITLDLGRYFESKSECNKWCTNFKYPSKVVYCNIPRVVGPCRARIPRYFYNHTNGKCELFYYGGCGGKLMN